MPALGVPQDLLEEDARRRALEAMASGAVEAPALAPLPAGPPTSRVAVASGVPQEVEPPPLDEYGEALAEVRRREIGHLGGDLGSGIIKAFTGVGRDPAMQQAMDAQTQAPVVEYLQRQKMADDKRRLDLTAQKAAPKPGASLSPDPASPASRRAQALVEAVVPGMFTPEQLALIPETEAEKIRADALKSQGIEAGREVEVGRAGRARSRNEQDRAQFAQMMGYRWADMSQDERIAMMRLQDAREARDEAAAARGEKRAGELAERNVGGFEFDPTNPPSADAAKQMAQVSIQSQTLNQGLDALEALYNKSGTEIVGATAGTMGAEWKNLTDMLRNISNMGVPNGKDYEMLALQLENPTELRSLTTSKARGKAQMKAVRDQIRRLVSATATAYKFRPVGQATKGPSQTPNTVVPTPSPAVTPPTPRRKKDAQGRVWEEQPDGSARLVL